MERFIAVILTIAVILAEVRIQGFVHALWIPACAGMTVKKAGMTVKRMERLITVILTIAVILTKVRIQG